MRFLPFLLLVAASLAAQNLEIHVLRVEFKYEDPDNSLTTGRGVFADSCKADDYWEKQIDFAREYFKKASGGKVNIFPRIYPKIYKLDSSMISYNRTQRKKGEKMEEFDSVRTADYARFVNDVLDSAKKDISPAGLGKRAILIAHAGHSRLIDGGTMGTRGANTPGDFIDAYIDTSWRDSTHYFWNGFAVSEGDTITSVMVTSETAEQDGLNWGIQGTITSQIGRELGLPYTFDVVKGYSRLGYFDGMDFAGYNAGDGFFPSLPSAWLRIDAGWDRPVEVRPGKDTTIYICSVSCTCGSASPQTVKVPVNSNEYILLENRQRMCDGNSSIDTALPASGIAAWRINSWYLEELRGYGAVNAWGGDTFRDHQFGIALIEADGVLGLGKEFKAANGESAFYFGSGSDLIPHKKFKSKDTVFSIEPAGYANTASTFGGYSGIRITAKIPGGAKEERSFNFLTMDSVMNWQTVEIPVTIEWVGKYVKPVSVEKLPSKEDFSECKESPKPAYLDKSYNLGSEIFCPLDEKTNRETIFLGSNRLYIVDSNGVPLPKFPAILSNGEPLTDFRSKPLALDIDGDGSREILIPANNGLILAVNSEGKLLKGEFPITAGSFVYGDTIAPMRLLHRQSGDSIYLFALHRDSIRAFYLPEAKEFKEKETAPDYKDEISEFFIYPNPIRAGRAAMRFRIKNDAANATLEIFDITGFRVFKREDSNLNYGSHQMEGLDFSGLGSDIYSARLTVKFANSGKRKEKWVRIGVVRK